MSRVLAILDRARWAPSGDNVQNWGFEVIDESHVVVHGFDTRDHVVYDLDGTSSQIALGALLETITIAASCIGLRTIASRRRDAPDPRPVFDVRFSPDDSLVPDPLASTIETRSVQRRPLSTRALTTDERSAMDRAVGPDHQVTWLEGAPTRRRIAKLLFDSAKLRLTMPEAYLVHRDAIDWAQRFSHDRVPEAAVGLDPGTARLMRWVMKSWDRVEFFNRYLAGTVAPRVQLDLIPAMRCAAHFVLSSNGTPSTIDDFVAGGRATQRLWLTATSLGLQLQPELTPLIFARYSRNGLSFSRLAGSAASAGKIADRLDTEVGVDAAHRGVFMGRVGAGKPAVTRSLRRPLNELMFDPANWPRR